MADVDITVSMIDKTKAAGASVNQTLGDIEKSSKGTKQGLGDAAATMSEVALAAQTSTMAWTEFYSAYSTVLQVVEKGKELWNETIGVTVELANEVRQFRDVTGQTSEESSRLVQVLDDYKVSTSAAEMATKKLAKEGLEFNISTLADLSDEYLSLNSDVERTNFLYEKFGKSGTDFVEIMKQGGDAIREASDAIDENLILTDKQLKAARDYEKQVDNLSDTWQGFKVAAGNDAIPYVVNALDTLNKKTEESSLAMAVFTFGWDDVARVFTQTHKDMQVSVEELDKGEKDNIVTMQEMAASAEEDLGAALKATSDHLTGMIGLIDNMQSAEENYTEKSQDLADQRAEAEQKLAELKAQGADIGNAAYDEALAKLNEVKEAEANLAAEREKQTLQFVSNILQEQLARDGWTQSEFDAFAAQQEAWGLWSADVVEKARAAWEEADKITASIEAIPSSKDVFVNVQTNYSADAQSALEQQYTYGSGRASGGSVSGGMMYPVNEKGMPELLNFGGKQMLMMPESGSGYVTPLSTGTGGAGAAGGTTIINIMLDSATPDPERVAYQLAPAVERVLRSKKLI